MHQAAEPGAEGDRGEEQGRPAQFGGRGLPRREEQEQGGDLADEEAGGDRRAQFGGRPVLVDQRERRTAHPGRGFRQSGDRARADVRRPPRRERGRRQADDGREYRGDAHEEAEAVFRDQPEQRQPGRRGGESRPGDPAGTAQVERGPFTPGDVQVERDHRRQDEHRDQTGVDEPGDGRDDQGEAESAAALHERGDDHRHGENRQHLRTQRRALPFPAFSAL